MTDDDRTVDADGETMDELRRLANEARNHPATEERTDVTVDADGATMDELRRFAAEVRRQASALAPPSPTSTPQPVETDITIDADAPTMDELRELAAEVQAARSAGAADPTIPLPPHTNGSTASVSPSQPELTAPPDVTTHPSVLTRVPLPPTPTPPAVVDVDSHSEFRGRSSVKDPPAVPSGKSGESWRPPPRMVMPTEPEKRSEHHHGPWKRIAVGLAVVVVILLALLVLGVLGGGDDSVPTDDSVPGSIVGDGNGVDDGGSGAGG